MTANIWTATVPIERARAGLAALRARDGIAEGFSPQVLQATRAAIAGHVPAELDLTDIEFVTLDPAESTDLDQALHISADGGGYLVRYAIADVPGYVELDGLLDEFTRGRGETIYCPDTKISLHPPLLADDAGSLLPGVERTAYVWTIRVDSGGATALESLVRAQVRSRAKLGYESEQRALEQGHPHPQVALLREVGELRKAQEIKRGAVSLPRPAQEVREHDSGFALVYRTPEPVEDWNAQISLMTGMAAAELMLDGGVGLLRTMPPPASGDLSKVRAAARGLDIPWPKSLPYPQFIRTLDPGNPRHAALLSNVTVLMRGAGYTAFDGELPQLRTHSAIVGPYAHVTAPLRRLVDRFGLMICYALANGQPVPARVRAALPELPDLMAASGRRASAINRVSMDFLEAEMLAGREGVPFRGVVVEQRKNDGILQVSDPAIIAKVRGTDLPVGEWVDAWLAVVDPGNAQLLFDVTPRSQRYRSSQ
ncbi:MAG: RNB domain-containing ribonuclease [Candidatus Nanopelagicales bacterium]